MSDEKVTIEDLEYVARLRTWLEKAMGMKVTIVKVTVREEQDGDRL